MTVFRQLIRNSAKCIREKPAWFQRSKVVVFQQNAWIQQSTKNVLTKPKKPQTPYTRYVTKVKPWIQETNLKARQKDIEKVIAQQWEKVDNDTRVKLEKEFKKEMVDYSFQFKVYKNSLGDAEREAIKKENLRKLQLKQEMIELGKPVKPPTAFILFKNSKSHTRGCLPYKEWRQGIISEWNNLPENEKDIYRKDFKLKYDVYKTHLEKWEKQNDRKW